MTKTSAVLLILLGGTCMSFVGLIMRLISEADGFQILAYRSISLAAIVGLVACLKRRHGPGQFLAGLDRADLQMGLALSLAFMSYVFAMLTTSVASTLLILTSSPFLAALISWIWIGERVRAVTWLAIIAGMIGVAVMFKDGADYGRTSGNLMALGSAFLFALMLVLARRSRKTDVLGGTFLGGVFAGLLGAGIAVIFGQGLGVNMADLALCLFMGAFTIGIGIAFVTWGTPYVPAAEVGLLVLIESVLGPVWVWIALGEAMSRSEIVGGSIVLSAVAFQALTARPRRRT
jgi:DME family drug/metabolite transporter